MRGQLSSRAALGWWVKVSLLTWRRPVMKPRMLLMLAGMLAGLTVPALAQEKLSAPAPVEQPPPEKAPPPKELPSPTPLVGLPAPCCAECEHPTLKILWMNYLLPVQRLVPRDVITTEKRSTLGVATRIEKRCVTEIVFKEQECVKEVPVCTMRPVTETDPHTGKCCTVLKPVTEKKLVKDKVFVAVPEQRIIDVAVPYLTPVEVAVPRRNILFEYRTELKPCGCPVAVPCGAEWLPPRMMAVPPPPCPPPHHP
jgi:hypothetical protein